jgi:hypothetical protein
MWQSLLAIDHFARPTLVFSQLIFAQVVYGSVFHFRDSPRFVSSIFLRFESYFQAPLPSG